MKMEVHVLRAIDAFERGHKDEALWHACTAIDATARALNGVEQTGGKAHYKSCLRRYYWLIERFLGGGVNLEETKWTNVKLDNGYGEDILEPDLADIIYHVFRCSNAHGKEIPVEYDLIPREENGDQVWIIGFQDGRLQMPESIIWALVAVSVFAECHKEIITEGDYFLSWQAPAPSLETINFIIKDSWGIEARVKPFFSKYPYSRVTLNLSPRPSDSDNQ